MSGFASGFLRELAHLRRDRWDLAMITLGPFLLILVVAAMFWEGVPRNLPVGVVDQDQSAFSRAIVRALDASSTIDVTTAPADLPQAIHLIRSGEAWAAVHIPKGAGEGRARAQTPAIHIFYNASFLSTGSLAAGAAHDAVRAVIVEHGREALNRRGLPQPRLNLPSVQVGILFNPQTSFEFYLEALIFPAVLHLLIACAAALAAQRGLAEEQSAAALIGRLAPAVLAISFWGAIWIIWLAGFAGWKVLGSLSLLLLAQGLLFAATASLSLVLLVLTRDANTALSASAVYAGSALAYSGGTLPLTGGSAVARFWSEALPFTHYLRLQMDQFIGAPVLVALPELAALSAYLMVPLLASLALLRQRTATA